MPSNLPEPLSFIILPSPQANSSQFIIMSNSIHRRRVPTPVGNGGRSLRTKRASRYVFDKHGSKYTNQVFERSFSESNLNRRRDGDGNCMRQPSPVMSGLPTEESDPIVYLPRIRSEVMASSPSLLGFSSPSSPFPTNQEVRDSVFRAVILFLFLLIFKSNSWCHLCITILHIVHKV